MKQKLQHPNYCRQFLKQVGAVYDVAPAAERTYAMYLEAARVARDAQKFIFPWDRGVQRYIKSASILEGQYLRLPFPAIALEVELEKYEKADVKKIIILAEQTENEDIHARSAHWFHSVKKWAVTPAVIIPKGLLMPSYQGAEEPKFMYKKTDESTLVSDARNADVLTIGVLGAFLVILQCSNVHIERSEAKKQSPKTKGGRTQPALPFDDYHILTVGDPRASGNRDNAEPCGRHSPREHLRRGHIRRLASGAHTWVNAAVIGANRGAGTITKDYVVRHGELA